MVGSGGGLEVGWGSSWEGVGGKAEVASERRTVCDSEWIPAKTLPFRQEIFRRQVSMTYKASPPPVPPDSPQPAPSHRHLGFFRIGLSNQSGFHTAKNLWRESHSPTASIFAGPSAAFYCAAVVVVEEVGGRVGGEGRVTERLLCQMM